MVESPMSVDFQHMSDTLDEVFVQHSHKITFFPNLQFIKQASCLASIYISSKGHSNWWKTTMNFLLRKGKLLNSKNLNLSLYP